MIWLYFTLPFIPSLFLDKMSIEKTIWQNCKKSRFEKSKDFNIILIFNAYKLIFFVLVEAVMIFIFINILSTTDCSEFNHNL